MNDLWVLSNHGPAGDGYALIAFADEEVSRHCRELVESMNACAAPRVPTLKLRRLYLVDSIERDWVLGTEAFPNYLRTVPHQRLLETYNHLHVNGECIKNRFGNKCEEKS